MTAPSVATYKIDEAPPEHVLRPEYRPYQPFGGALSVFYDKSPEILYCGPAGTGKSRGTLEKLHFCASKYKGMRGLIVRKTRESITQSAKVTFDKFVMPENGTVKFRTSEQEYRYSNGSALVIGGMDKSSKVLSSEYDMIYVQQAEELTEEDWETLTTRCRLGNMPYNQVIGDVNPAYPKHWLNQRRLKGEMSYIVSKHKDNPILWDHALQEWTKRGKDYIAKLKRLTGVRRKRLYLGLWAAAEGMIFDEWDEHIHLVNKKSIPSDWLRVWTFDFGFVHPFVWQAWAIDEYNDVAYRYAEIYYTKRLVEEHAAKIKEWMVKNNEPYPTAIVADHDAEGRATLEKHLDVEIFPANKKVLAGIDAVKSMLKSPTSGNTRIKFMRDSLLEVDPDLSDFSLPTCTEDEIEGYEWMDNKKKESPIKRDDHGCDGTRYFAKWWEDGGGGWSMGMAR